MAAFKKWEDVLSAIQADDSDSFFCIHINEGERELDRTRFMSKLEATAYCFYKLGRQRIGF